MELFNKVSEIIKILKPEPFKQFSNATKKLKEINLQLKQTSSIDSVVRWHDWKNITQSSSCFERNNLSGWRNDNYRSSYVQVFDEDLDNLIVLKIIKNWRCDIKNIHGISCSKSDLNKFFNLDDMIKSVDSAAISDISENGFYNNLNHKGIRIIHKQFDTDHFQKHCWDERFFLCNSDGSHHFAAARYIASQLNLSFELSGDLYEYSINWIALSKLLNKYNMFVIQSNVYDFFHYFMEKYNISYYFKPMPEPYKNLTVIFLPNDNQKAKEISTVLIKNQVYNLGTYFVKLCK
ncbi:MAG: hypothetical protein K2P99_01930 [Burkholderiales bacterium]|nr:hypothetical protein [Burkholderiales bacterium]